MLDTMLAQQFTAFVPFQELGKLVTLKKDFEQRNCKILCIAAGSCELFVVNPLRSSEALRYCLTVLIRDGAADDHDEWIRDVSETEEVEVDFPIVADDDAEILRMVRMQSGPTR